MARPARARRGVYSSAGRVEAPASGETGERFRTEAPSRDARPVAPREVDPRVAAQRAGAAAAQRRFLRALLPLRFFVGGTFLYAGLDKLLNPAFLREGGAGSIAQQLQGFTHASPLAPLIEAVALPHPQIIGGLMALAEIGVGLGVVLGLFYRWSAILGFLISVLFFLTASWSTQPYYYGPDLPYAAGFLTLALIGRPGPYSVAASVRRSLAGPASTSAGGRRGPAGGPGTYSPERRALLEGSVLGALAVLLTGSVWGLTRLGREDGGDGNGAFAPAANGTGTGGGSSPGAAASGGSGSIGTVSQISQQGAIQFTDPGSGDPAYALQVNGQLVAYDATCTHQGCTVEYVPGQQLFGCPCHGATFDAAHGGAVINGPARQPLRQIAVRTDGQGNVFVSG